MTAALHIPAGERGVIRVFALDMPPEQVKFLAEPGALEQILGIGSMNRDQTEIFPVSDLEELGLTGYLAEGCGVPADELARCHDALSALDGYVLLIRSRAFDGNETRLTPADPVQLIATLNVPGTDWTAKPLTSDSAEPHSAPRVSPRAARSRARRIGFTLFAVMMTLITFVFLLLVF